MNFINLDNKVHTLDDFDILEIIDRSSDYSTVFKAFDKHSGKIVAIKMINIVDAKDLQTIISSLKPPPPRKNICQVYKSFGQEGKLFIVMEYFAGGSIQDILQLICYLDYEVVKVILKEIVIGVVEIHEANQVHRHIKCFSLQLTFSKAANVFLSSEGKIKLSYFSPNQEFSETLNKSKSHIISLPYWLSPENSIYDDKSDIWALGITAFELITGHNPYKEIPPQKVIFIIANENPPKLDEKYPEQNREHLISNREYRDFVKACLQKNPKERLNSKQLLDHPVIKKTRKPQLLFELFEKYQMMKNSPKHKNKPKEMVNSIQGENCKDHGQFTYMHQRVRTSFRVDSKGLLISEGMHSNESVTPNDNEGSVQSIQSQRDSLNNGLEQVGNQDQLEQKTSEENEQSGLAFLSIKRNIRKIEKYKPGLTKQVKKMQFIQQDSIRNHFVLQRSESI